MATATATTTAITAITAITATTRTATVTTAKGEGYGEGVVDGDCEVDGDSDVDGDVDGDSDGYGIYNDYDDSNRTFFIALHTIPTSRAISVFNEIAAGWLPLLYQAFTAFLPLLTSPASPFNQSSCSLATLQSEAMRRYVKIKPLDNGK